MTINVKNSFVPPPPGNRATITVQKELNDQNPDLTGFRFSLGTTDENGIVSVIAERETDINGRAVFENLSVTEVYTLAETSGRSGAGGRYGNPIVTGFNGDGFGVRSDTNGLPIRITFAQNASTAERTINVVITVRNNWIPETPPPPPDGTTPPPPEESTPPPDDTTPPPSETTSPPPEEETTSPPPDNTAPPTMTPFNRNTPEPPTDPPTEPPTEPPVTPEPETPVPEPEEPAMPTPLEEGNILVPQEDGTFMEFRPDGTPLGTWEQDPTGTWIFNEETPLGGMPVTGETPVSQIVFLAGLILLAVGIVMKVFKRRKSVK
jgi:hypothetical protein